MATGKSIDCRDYPSGKDCSLKISGTEEEVLDAAVQHALGPWTREFGGMARRDSLAAERRKRLGKFAAPWPV